MRKATDSVVAKRVNLNPDPLDALEEEKRNASVALTRSKRIVALSYSRTKNVPWGDVWEQRPSRYLKFLELV